MTPTLTRTILATAAAMLLSSAAGQQSVKVHTSGLQWTAVELPGVPKGIQQKALHENPKTKASSALVRFPKGFTEPAHYHTTCGHSIYIIKGKIRTPQGDLTPGSYTYAAVKDVHGPMTAVEETEFLFYTDGPFDYHIAEKK